MDDAISNIEAALDFAGSQGWHPFHCDDICALLDRLKAAEAENKRLREALERLARLGNGDQYGNSDGNMIARAALENTNVR